jgi:hypothetical protein
MRGVLVADLDYAVTGVALLAGLSLAAGVTMISLVRTARVPPLATVLIVMLGCAALVLGLVEGSVPH